MKKLLSFALASALALSVLTGCGQAASVAASSTAASSEAVSSTETAVSSQAAASSEAVASSQATTPETVATHVAALKGPTAMGMVKMMADAEDGTLSGYDFTIAASADEVTPQLIQGGLDIAAVPANLASVLYNKTSGGVQVLAINTLGVLYIVQNGEGVASVADLRGKTIYASGKGSTPEYALRYILTQNGLDPDTDVTIEWKSEHTECLTSLLAEEGGVALLPQPFVTTAQMQNENVRVALDLNQEWDALAGDSALITGVVVARTEFAQQNPDAVKTFLQNYAQSVEYVNGNNAEAAALIEKYDIVKAAVAEKALPACNITFVAGADLKAQLSGYLDVLYAQNPESVGGAVPGEDFYYNMDET